MNTTISTIACVALLGGCSSGDAPARSRATPSSERRPQPSARAEVEAPNDEATDPDEEIPMEERYSRARALLVAQLRAQGITSEQVLEAIRSVNRHDMVPDALEPYAYENRPLPIGYEQTISQPYIVGLMTQLADIQPGDDVLEIGTGSGYQAAVLAETGANVHSIEIVEPLARRTRALLDEMGYDQIETRIGDGYAGWPDEAPFDAIVITAAPPAIPEPLKEQLAIGGKLVVPVGDRHQELVVLTRTEDGFERERSVPVRFVPMTGEAQQQTRAEAR